MTQKVLQDTRTDNPIVQAVKQARLVIMLMMDTRVSPWAKLVMLAAGVYAASPIDLLMIPGVGIADDLAVIAFCQYLFVSLCPPKVVKELLK